MATRQVAAVVIIGWACACGRSPQVPQPGARNLLLITIDTLRADRVGAYGYARAQTPALDALAARGLRFERAFAPAPITLPSHASLLTGRYPPGHGSRDNGMRVRPDVPTLATELRARGFATAAFVAAFPLDRRFGLERGFEVYGDHLPRGDDGRPLNERPAREVVDEAVAWLERVPAGRRFFLWVHLFEPHAPYGSDPSAGNPSSRYDQEVAIADRQVGRLLAALGPAARDTLVVATADHGEAFGEHDEIGHSVFVYDTTLRVPLILAGPGVTARVVQADVSLIDVAPSAMRRLGEPPFDTDGVDVSNVVTGGEPPKRELYAESFAPLVEFGWAPLRSVRIAPWKFIEAPEAELYDVARDPAEMTDVREAQAQVSRQLADRVSRYGPAELPTDAAAPLGGDARARLGALGYVAGGPRPATGARPDPKSRRALAARIAQVTSGELQGDALKNALVQILAEDPGNTQAHLRLGAFFSRTGQCTAAMPHLSRVIAQKFPSADPYIILASCAGRSGNMPEAAAALEAADRIEPGNPVVIANLGVLHASTGALDAARTSFERALQIDPALNEARFNLARVYARLGRRADAAREAHELLARLPAGAPQRAEVERLLAAVQ